MSEKEYGLWKKYGASQKDTCITLGPHSSYEWKTSCRRLIFSAARYKFAMKMIGSIYRPDEKDILELGCSDGFGAHFVAEFAKSVLCIDFDEEAVSYAQEHNGDAKVTFQKDDFLEGGGRKYGEFDGIVSFDVIEHIYPENERAYMQAVTKNLKDAGTFVIGTPSWESQQYTRGNIAGPHVNVYKGEDLYRMLGQYFHHVYLFTQNDEIIHTGHLRMANYLVAVCSHKKETGMDGKGCLP